MAQLPFPTILSFFVLETKISNVWPRPTAFPTLSGVPFLTPTTWLSNTSLHGNNSFKSLRTPLQPCPWPLLGFHSPPPLQHTTRPPGLRQASQSLLILMPLPWLIRPVYLHLPVPSVNEVTSWALLQIQLPGFTCPSQAEDSPIYSCSSPFPPSVNHISTWMTSIISNSPCPKVESSANRPIFL